MRTIGTVPVEGSTLDHYFEVGIDRGVIINNQTRLSPAKARLFARLLLEAADVVDGGGVSFEEKPAEEAMAAHGQLLRGMKV